MPFDEKLLEPIGVKGFDETLLEEVTPSAEPPSYVPETPPPAMQPTPGYMGVPMGHADLGLPDVVKFGKPLLEVPSKIPEALIRASMVLPTPNVAQLLRLKPKEEREEAIKGYAEEAAKLASGLTTPENVALGPAAYLNPEIALPAFVAWGQAQLPGAIKRREEAKTPSEKAAANLGIAATLGMIAGPVAGVGRPKAIEKPPVIPVERPPVIPPEEPPIIPPEVKPVEPVAEPAVPAVEKVTSGLWEGMWDVKEPGKEPRHFSTQEDALRYVDERKLETAPPTAPETGITQPKQVESGTWQGMWEVRREGEPHRFHTKEEAQAYYNEYQPAAPAAEPIFDVIVNRGQGTSDAMATRMSDGAWFLNGERVSDVNDLEFLEEHFKSKQQAAPAAETKVEPSERAAVPAVDIREPEQRRIPSYGEKYIAELGIEKARQRVDHLNRRTEEELKNRPVDHGAIKRLQQEAQNIANAIDAAETKGVENAPQERQVQESVLGERERTEAQRIPPETSVSDSLQPAAPVTEAPPPTVPNAPARESVLAGPPPKEPVTVEPKGKEPWEMTKQEFLDSMLDKKGQRSTKKAIGNLTLKQWREQEHVAAVGQALQEGKPVPPEVLKDYPDLQPPSKTAEGKGVVGTYEFADGSKAEVTTEPPPKGVNPPEGAKGDVVYKLTGGFTGGTRTYWRPEDVQKRLNKYASERGGFKQPNPPPSAPTPSKTEVGKGVELEMAKGKLRAITEQFNRHKTTKRQKSELIAQAEETRKEIARLGGTAEDIQEATYGTRKPLLGGSETQTLAEPGSTPGVSQPLQKKSEKSDPLRDLRGIESASKQPTPPPAAETGEKGPGMEGSVGDAAASSTARTGTAPPEFYEGTSLKNATAEVERAAYGLPEATPTQKRAMAEQWIESGKVAEADPFAAQKLIDSLKVNPGRGLTDLESATILREKVRVENAMNDAAERTFKETDPARKAAAQGEWDSLSNRLLEIMDAAKHRGSVWGREGRWRQAVAYTDFSFASLERQMRMNRGGAPLTDAERVQLKAMADKWKATADSLQKDLATSQARVSLLEAQREIDKAIKETPLPYDKRILDYAEKFVVRMESAADAAKARILQRRKEGRQYVGIDVEQLGDYALVGSAKLARGVKDFAAWSDSMVADLGEFIKEDLKQIWEASNRLLEDNLKPIPEKVKTTVRKIMSVGERKAAIESQIQEKILKGKLNDLQPVLRKYERVLAEQGIRNRDVMIDTIHAFASKLDPRFTRDMTMDAISGYGDFRPLTKDEIDVVLRDLHQQYQQLGKLRDMAAGQAPKRTGFQRQAPSDEGRRLIQQVEEAKRRGGYTVTDPEAQLRSALDAAKKRLTDQIADLDHQIQTRQKIVKNRTKLQYYDEYNKLKALRDEKKALFDEVFPKEPMSDARRLEIAIETTKRSIAELERRVAERDIAPRPTAADRPAAPALEVLKQQREALSAQLREMRKKPAAQREDEAIQRRIEAMNKAIAEKERQLASGEVAPAAQQVNRPLRPELEQARQRLDELNAQLREARKAPPRPEEVVRLEAWNRHVDKRMAELQERIKNKDFSKKVRRPPPTLGPKELEKQDFMARLQEQFHELLLRGKYKNMHGAQKAYMLAKEAMNIPRNVMTSADVSAVLRQGGILSASHPVIAARALVPMFKGMASERMAGIIDQEILSRPNAKSGRYAQAKLYLAPLRSTTLSAMEEQIMSRFAHHIPLVRASNRAFITFLNRLRADSFDAFTEALETKGAPLNEAELKAIANYINITTGRGDLGARYNAGAELAATVLFSPRLVTSRFQFLAGQPLYRGSARTRALVAQEYGRSLTALAVFLGLGYLAGGTVELDPRSSDFGKLRFGNTRLDPMAGLSQSAVFLSRTGAAAANVLAETLANRKLLAGETKTVKGRLRMLGGPDVGYGQKNFADVVLTFLRSKFAPVVGSTIDVLSRMNMVGEKVTPGDVIGRFEPLSETALGRAAGIESEIPVPVPGTFTMPLSMQDAFNVMKEHGVARGIALEVLSLFGMGLQYFDPSQTRRK